MELSKRDVRLVDSVKEQLSPYDGGVGNLVSPFTCPQIIVDESQNSSGKNAGIGS